MGLNQAKASYRIDIREEKEKKIIGNYRNNRNNGKSLCVDLTSLKLWLLFFCRSVSVSLKLEERENLKFRHVIFHRNNLMMLPRLFWSSPLFFASSIEMIVVANCLAYEVFSFESRFWGAESGDSQKKEKKSLRCWNHWNRFSLTLLT